MQIARSPARHAEHPGTIADFVSPQRIAAAMAAVEEPFGAGDRCALSPDGQHYGIGSCGDVVCCHCARIFWS